MAVITPPTQMYMHIHTETHTHICTLRKYITVFPKTLANKITTEHEFHTQRGEDGQKQNMEFE